MECGTDKSGDRLEVCGDNTIAFLHIAEGDAAESSPFVTFLLVLFVCSAGARNFTKRTL